VLKSLGANRRLYRPRLAHRVCRALHLGIAAGVGLSYARGAPHFWRVPNAVDSDYAGLDTAARRASLGRSHNWGNYPAWLASRKDPVEALSYD